MPCSPYPAQHHHSPPDPPPSAAPSQGTVGCWRDPSITSDHWRRSRSGAGGELEQGPSAHVRLHLRHLQSSLPAGLLEGGRGRVDRIVPGAGSQGRLGCCCVTLRAALRGHVTVSHSPQYHQPRLLPLAAGHLCSNARSLPAQPPDRAGMLRGVWLCTSEGCWQAGPRPRALERLLWLAAACRCLSPPKPSIGSILRLLAGETTPLLLHPCVAQGHQPRALPSPCLL